MNARVLILAAAVLCAAAPARAQDNPDTTTHVRAGMSENDVRARWGEPVAVRRVNDWTYLFYANGEERTHGLYDTVFLQGGQVVDAIVRAEGRVYSGTSSSPPGRIPAFTPPNRPAGDTAATVGGVRVTPPPPVTPKPER